MSATVQTKTQNAALIQLLNAPADKARGSLGEQKALLEEFSRILEEIAASFSEFGDLNSTAAASRPRQIDEAREAKPEPRRANRNKKEDQGRAEAGDASTNPVADPEIVISGRDSQESVEPVVSEQAKEEIPPPADDEPSQPGPDAEAPVTGVASDKEIHRPADDVSQPVVLLEPDMVVEEETGEGEVPVEVDLTGDQTGGSAADKSIVLPEAAGEDKEVTEVVQEILVEPSMDETVTPELTETAFAETLPETVEGSLKPQVSNLQGAEKVAEGQAVEQVLTAAEAADPMTAAVLGAQTEVSEPAAQASSEKLANQAEIISALRNYLASATAPLQEMLRSSNAQSETQAIVGSQLLKPVLDLGVSKSADVRQQLSSVTIQQVTAADGGSSARWANDSQIQDNGGRPASKLVPRATVLQAVEKVEAVLKEAVRAKDGTSISLRLDPPSLGNVKVDVTLREGMLHARLVAESPQVNALLRERAQELQATLRRLGLDVERVSVAVSSDNGSMNWGDGLYESNGRNFEESGLGGWAAGRADEVLQAKEAGLGQIQGANLDHWVA